VARPKAFDETAALEAAMTCFWEKGFEASSVQDLTDRMGIARPSLYNAFGNKRALFEKALEHYCRTSTYRVIARIEAEYEAEDRVAELFAEVVDRSAKDPNRRGCLLINSALEVSPHHPDLRRVIGVHLGAVRSFFQRSLAAAPETARLDLRASADNLMAVILGLRVLARSMPERPLLDSVVAGALVPLGLGDAWQRRRRKARRQTSARLRPSGAPVHARKPRVKSKRRDE